MPYTEDQIRAIIQCEAGARLALKTAKAEAFLAHVDQGARVADAWQRVALETAELEVAYERARTEKLVLWIMSRGDAGAEVESEPS